MKAASNLDLDRALESIRVFWRSTDPFDPIELHVSVPFDFSDLGIESTITPTKLVVDFSSIPVINNKYLPIGTSVLLNMRTGEARTITSKKS